MTKKKTKKKTKRETKKKTRESEVKSEPVLMLDKLVVTITPTSNGLFNYMQIASGAAAMPVNIVLIAEEIVVQDHRQPEEK